jgi:hypothetical protein
MALAYELQTLQEAITYFSDADNCLNYLGRQRWPNGVVCPTCGSKDVILRERGAISLVPVFG